MAIIFPNLHSNHLPQALQGKAEALTNAYTKAEASGIAVSNSHPICRNPTACLLHTTKKKNKTTNPLPQNRHHAKPLTAALAKHLKVLCLYGHRGSTKHC